MKSFELGKREIDKHLWDLRGAELSLITMRADIDLSQSGYVRDLMSNQCDEAYKINRIIALNPKIAAELQAWADRWIVVEKCYNIVISDPDGEIPTATIMEVASGEVAAKNCRNNPKVHDDFFIIALSWADAHGNLWGEKVGRRQSVLPLA